MTITVDPDLAALFLGFAFILAFAIFSMKWVDKG